ncbi:MAG: hypothetical protein U0892_03310 [Pirellulales bacterium]
MNKNGLIQFIAILVAADLVVANILNQVVTDPEQIGGYQNAFFLVVLLSGFLAGQWCALGVVSGCIGRKWMVGCVMGMIAATSFHAASMSIAFGLQKQYELFATSFDYQLSVLILVPVMTLIQSAPSLAMRGLRKWIIPLSSKWDEAPKRFSLQSIFLFGAFAASVIVLIRNAHETIGGSNAGVVIASVLFGSVLLSAASNLIALPMASLMFAKHSRRSATAAGCVVAFGCLIWAAFFFFTARSSPAQGLVFVVLLIACILAVATYCGLLICLSRCGYRIQFGSTDRLKSGAMESSDQVHLVSESVAEDVAATEEEPNVGRSSHSALRLYWDKILLVAAILLVGFSSFAVGSKNHRRVKEEMALQEAVRYWVQSGCEVGLNREGLVVEMRVGKDFGDDDLARVAEFHGLKRLSLARSRVTDAGLRFLLNIAQLEEVDLSYTLVSDSGLRYLQGPRLRGLSLNGTSVTNEGLQSFLQSHSLGSLEFGDRKFDDSDLKKLPALFSLGLSRTQITDSGISEYLSANRCDELDVSYTTIDGSGLIKAPNSLRQIVLDGTKLSQANFEALTKNPDISLSICETEVELTPEVTDLDSIRLRIGGGAITESQLLLLGNGRFSYLSVRDRAFSGSFIKNGNLSYRVLNLSNSAITDAILKQQQIMGVESLDVSYTDLSDKCLTAFDRLTALQLNVRGTKITADGLMESSIAPQTVINVAPTQFSPEDMVQLRERFKIRCSLDEAFGDILP